MTHHAFLDKPFWQSKTLWVNVATLAVAVLTALSGQADVIPPEAMPYIVGALSVANLVLRYLTKQPLALK